MEFRRVTLSNCEDATGAVIVVDVIRAFTVAAYAFASGAADIRLTGTVDEALSLRDQMPGAWVMGEVNGLRPQGFDLGNSPSALSGLDLHGRHLIQRTSAGTQGVVRSSERADTLLACSLCCARGTAEYVCKLTPRTVTFVITGVHAGSEDDDGDEDRACADYVEALLRGGRPDVRSTVQRVLESDVAQVFLDPARPEFPAADLDYCVDVDCFDFAMQVVRQDGQLMMRPVRSPHR